MQKYAKNAKKKFLHVSFKMYLQAQMSLFNSLGILDFLKYFFLVYICGLFKVKQCDIHWLILLSITPERHHQASDNKKYFWVAVFSLKYDHI